MKKTQVLKYLPDAKVYARDAVQKYKAGDKLVREAAEAQKITDALKRVELHDGFPIRVCKYGKDIDISSACDETKRSAYVKPVGTKYIVIAYKNTGTFDEDEGIPVEGEFKKSEALRVAKDYVATGKNPKPEESKRGRVAK